MEVSSSTSFTIRRAIRLESNELEDANTSVERAQQGLNNALERRHLSQQRLDDLLKDAAAMGIPIDQELGMPVNQCSPEPAPRIVKDQPQA